MRERDRKRAADAGVRDIEQVLSVSALAEELFVVESECQALARSVDQMRLAAKCMGLASLMRHGMTKRKLKGLYELRELEFEAANEKLDKAKRLYEGRILTLQSEIAPMRQRHAEHEQACAVWNVCRAGRVGRV